jgi:hypothetical protein
VRLLLVAIRVAKVEPLFGESFEKDVSVVGWFANPFVDGVHEGYDPVEEFVLCFGRVLGGFVRDVFVAMAVALATLEIITKQVDLGTDPNPLFHGFRVARHEHEHVPDSRTHSFWVRPVVHGVVGGSNVRHLTLR